MKKQFIKDLKPGDKIRNFFVAERKHIESFRDKSKGHFLTIELADRSGHILGRAWENALTLNEVFEEGAVILVDGYVDTYQDRPQIVIHKLRMARPEDKDKYYSDDDFVPQTEKDIGALWSTVTAAAAGITNPYLKTLLQTILADDQLAAGLQTAPASKQMHHSYRGGLLEHIVEMLGLAGPLMELYPRLDQDLLISGIILHDLGLLEGARYELMIDYSDQGRLLGYPVLGDRLVAQHAAAIPDFPGDLALALSHMILSHPGELLLGALRPPQTLEATALYLLHKLSAELHHVQEVFDRQFDAEKPWTEHDRLMDRAYFRGRSIEPPAPPEAPPPTSSAPSEAAPESPDLPSIAERSATWEGKKGT